MGVILNLEKKFKMTRLKPFNAFYLCVLTAYILLTATFVWGFFTTKEILAKVIFGLYIVGSFLLLRKLLPYYEYFKR